MAAPLAMVLAGADPAALAVPAVPAVPAAPAPSNPPAPPCPLSPLDPAPDPFSCPCAPRDRDSWDADTRGTADTGDMAEAAAELDSADVVDISAAAPATGWGTSWSWGLLVRTGVPSTDMASWPCSFHAVRSNCSLGCRRIKFIGTFNSRFRFRLRLRFNFYFQTRRIIYFCFSLFLYFFCVFLFIGFWGKNNVYTGYFLVSNVYFSLVCGSGGNVVLLCRTMYQN